LLSVLVPSEFQGVFTLPETDPMPGGGSDSKLFDSVPAELIGTGQAQIEYIIEGETFRPFTKYGVRATPGNPDYIRKGYPVIELIASSDTGHSNWRLLLIVDPYQVTTGKNELEIDHFTVWAQLAEGEPGSKDAKRIAFVISGSLELDEFSREPGARVPGRFTLNMAAFREFKTRTP
jgi:hypothetical protein